MADTTARAASPAQYETADKTAEVKVDLGTNELESAHLPLANGSATKTGIRNKIAIRDASSPFLMDEDEEQGDLFRKGSRRAHEDDEQDSLADKLLRASSPGEAANAEVSLDGQGSGSTSESRTAGSATNGSKARGRGRSKRSIKAVPALFKDNELYNSSRAASPISSLDGQLKLRRNAPRLSVNASLFKKEDQPTFEDDIPDIMMLPPSSPPTQQVATNEPGHTPLKPYDASPRSIFRPPPSAALEIFNKPPSPSFRLAFKGQTLAEIPMSGSGSSLSSLPSSSSGLSGHLSGEPTPVTAVSSSLRTPLANTAEQDAGPSRLPNRATTPQMTIPVIRATRGSLVSTDTSPYAIKKVVVKTGVRKGKAKKGVAGFAAETEPNNDFCSTCNGIGRFLCCDGCPRSFHFMCLEPPLEVDQLPEEDEWFCKQCMAKRISRHQRTAHQGMFAPLLRYVERTNPTEFRLPDDIRNNFANVQTAFDGAYSDNYEHKPVKFDRSGFPEEKDLYKLKSKGKAVICFRCKGSAAPIGSGVAAGVALGRRMLSCDYCSLHWHLDCLDPPPPTMPHPVRKWMCPNHAQALLPKKRTMRTGMTEEIITRPGVRNNGIIEVVDPEAERKRIEMAERFINGKRYKIPEKIIHLDFWKKIGRPEMPTSPDEETPTVSIFGGQSPLSSVPSSPNLDDAVPLNNGETMEMTDEQLDPVIRALLRLAGKGTEQEDGPIEGHVLPLSGIAEAQLDCSNTAVSEDLPLPVVTGPLDAECLAFFDEHPVLAAEHNQGDVVPDQSAIPKVSQPPVETQGIVADPAPTDINKDKAAASAVSSVHAVPVIIAMSEQSAVVSDSPDNVSPEDLPIQAQPSPASALKKESSPLQSASKSVSPLKSSPHQVGQRASLVKPIVISSSHVAKRSMQLGNSTPIELSGQAPNADVPPPKSLRPTAPMQRPSVRPKSQFLPASQRGQPPPQQAAANQKLRKIAPSTKSVQPDLILQPSENVASLPANTTATLQSAAEPHRVTPAKRTATQAVLTQHSGKLGFTKQRQLAPRPEISSGVPNHGPLQAYSNPGLTRSDPTHSTGLPSYLAQGTDGAGAKITLKLPGQSELSARLASVQAQVNRQTEVPLDPDLDPYLDRFLAGLTQSPVPSPNAS